MKVFVVWDDSRVEHGEAEELVAIAESFRRAERWIEDNYEPDERDSVYVEERKVLK